MAAQSDAIQAQWRKLYGYLMGNQAAWIADFGLPNLEKGEISCTSRTARMGREEEDQVEEQRLHQPEHHAG